MAENHTSNALTDLDIFYKCYPASSMQAYVGFTKKLTGFDFEVDTIAGFIDYEASDTTNLYPIELSTELVDRIELSDSTPIIRALINGLVVVESNPLYEASQAANIRATHTTNLGNLSGTNSGNQTITLTGNITGTGTGSFSTTIANDVVTSAMINNGTIVNADINAAAIADSKLATISTSGKVSNSATNSNTASTIISRDASGNFSAGTITGNATNVTGTVAIAKGGGQIMVVWQ